MHSLKINRLEKKIFQSKLFDKIAPYQMGAFYYLKIINTTLVGLFLQGFPL